MQDGGPCCSLKNTAQSRLHLPFPLLQQQAGPEEGSGEQQCRHAICDSNANILVLVQIQCYVVTTVPASETSQLFPSPSVVRPMPSISKAMKGGAGMRKTWPDRRCCHVGLCLFFCYVRECGSCHVFFVCSMHFRMFVVPFCCRRTTLTLPRRRRKECRPFFLWLSTYNSPFVFFWLFQLLTGLASWNCSLSTACTTRLGCQPLPLFFFVCACVVAASRRKTWFGTD